MIQSHRYIISIVSLSSSLLFAENSLPRQTLKTNGQIIYNVKQKKVSTLKDMLNQGELFGRLRSNNFYYIFDHDDTSHQTSAAASVGASFVYKSASLKGIEFNVGLYGSQAFFNPNEFDNNIKLLKSAKDTFSRYNYVKTGSKALYTFAQANINYNYSKTDFTLGRQLVETFYTKSNDTKMIPNTFDALVVHSKDISKTELKIAYMAKEKLRDHESSHSLLMYDDSDLANYSMWRGNDDSAMHKGLSYTNLKAAGKSTDAPLIIFDLTNRTLKNLKINFSAYNVPTLLSQVMGELNYNINFHNFTLTPGVRYIQQFDNGAGSVGGASLLGDVNENNPGGYKDPNSLNGKMIALRLVAKLRDYKINIAYTDILDQGDLVTPWRGFPTAGYTRSMGIYNWRANSQSYRIELVKGSNSKGLYLKPFIQASVLYVNMDENKGILQDSIMYYLGLVQNVPSMHSLQYKLRLGHRDFIGAAADVSDYTDARCELNYLF